MTGSISHFELLSETEIQNAPNYHYAIVVAEWNKDITTKLCDGALNIFERCKIPIEHFNTYKVPGSFELPIAAKWALENKLIDAVICLGCIIKGETKHDEYIANAVSQALMQLNLENKKPVIFGVLTVESKQQAEDRSGGQYGNKGEEAAITAIKMLQLKNNIKF